MTKSLGEASQVAPAHNALAASIGERLSEGANHAIHAGASACLIAVKRDGSQLSIAAPAGINPNAATIARAVLSAFERRMGPMPTPGRVWSLSPPELSGLKGLAAVPAEGIDAVATHFAAGSGSLTVVLLAPVSTPSSSLESLALLIAGLARAELQAEEAASSREFWRQRATEATEDLAVQRLVHERTEADQQALDAAVAAAHKLSGRNRLLRLAAIIADTGPFDAWMVFHPVLLDTATHNLAVRGVPAPSGWSADGSAVAQCMARQTSIVKSPTGTGKNHYPEDDLFAAYRAYLCIPIEGGVIALASSRTIEPKWSDLAESLISRLNPLVKSWMLEEEAQHHRMLVRSLGMRLFAAIDAERARIARDLHDDQGQLLSAAQLALDADTEQARGIFTRLTTELRARTRELRPATLGRSSLGPALRAELKRLAQAGIEASLVSIRGISRLSRPVQQVCYQVTREALTNIIRHSAATRVTISVCRREGAAHLVIKDNGRGFPPGAVNSKERSTGMGIASLAERLELLGGFLKIDSQPGSTTLTAQLPDLG